MQEATDFFMQAKSIFDDVLGAEHPRTLKWQEELFFLINAPAIQKLIHAAPSDGGQPVPSGASPPSAQPYSSSAASEWWMQNMCASHVRAADLSPCMAAR